jgi:hypothetical protein
VKKRLQTLANLDLALGREWQRIVNDKNRDAWLDDCLVADPLFVTSLDRLEVFKRHRRLFAAVAPYESLVTNVC